MFQFAALRCAKLFWTGFTGLTGFREEGVWDNVPDNPVNPVKKTPPCCICGKGEFMFGGTLFVFCAVSVASTASSASASRSGAVSLRKARTPTKTQHARTNAPSRAATQFPRSFQSISRPPYRILMSKRMRSSSTSTVSPISPSPRRTTIMRFHAGSNSRFPMTTAFVAAPH